MSRSSLIVLCIIYVIVFPLVNAESVNTDQKINENTGQRFTIRNYTENFFSGKDTQGLDSLSSDEAILQIPPAVKKYECVTFDQLGINMDLRSTSSHLSFLINGVEYPADLNRMDFESIDDGIDSYSGMLAGEANSSVLLTISDNATIGCLTLNDETFYIEPLQIKNKNQITERIPHIIYSSKDVEKLEFLIDNGPIDLNDNEPGTGYQSRTMDSEIDSVQSTDTMSDGRTAVTVLIVTDNQFYSDHSGYGWKIVAQDIIAEANRQFGRDDIGVILIPIYDDSKRQNLSNNQQIRTFPLAAFNQTYSITSLNQNSADLGLYLGGYDKTTADDQGLSDGYGNFSQPHYGRYSWAQMVPDESDNLYPGTTEARRVVTIHEIGHQFGAHHDDGDPNLKPEIDTPGYNRATSWPQPIPLHGTVMWRWYIQGFNTYEFSSSWLGYHGDAMHDNARRIRETKGNVSRYAICSSSIPSADFDWAPAGSPPVWQPITFTINYPPVNNPNYYYWDFGDGHNSSLETPEKIYNWPGTYTVRLTAGNCAGSSITSKDITISSVSSYFSFSGTPQSGSAPLKVYLSSEGTTPTPSSYNWSLGDGNYSSDRNPVHTYYENGTYTVTLTVVQGGVPNTKEMPNYITVAPHAPNASFTSFINSGSAPLFIQFNDTSINSPTIWNWTFDDGMMFNTTNPLQKNVSYTFTTAGTYNVTLTAENTLGSSTTSHQVTATNIPPPTNTNPFEKTSPGLYTYTSPAGMNSLTITIVGAGGGGGGGTYDSVSSTGNGGYGGNASQVKTITQRVSPGSIIPVYLGSKGSGGNGQCGQINGNPGSDGGFSSVGNILAMGGPGGTGGIYSPISSHWNGHVGQDGYGTGQYATSGSSSGEFFGGTGGIGRGAGGGGASATCTGTGGYGADGYVWIQPNFIPPPLANFTATPHAGTAPLTVRFTDTTTGNPTGWSWDFGDGNTTNADVQHPVHTYFENGTYTVSLTAMTSGGTNTKTKRNAVCAGGCRDDIGVYQDGTWQIDSNGNLAWDGGIDQSLNFGSPGDSLVYGDWNGNNRTKIGVFNNGSWLIDYNGNGVYDGPVIDRTASLGSPGQNPVVGDWNGDHNDEIGTEKDGFWSLDYNGNFAWDGAVIDRFAAFGQADDNPVVGDWNGDGRTKIGSEKDGFWSVDYNGNYVWDYPLDKFAGFGQANDNPVVGDWNGDHKDKIGSQKDGFWAVDYNGNFVWDGEVTDRFAGLGQADDLPVTGDWDSDGSDEIGSFVNGFWAMDYNGNYQWDGVVADRFAAFGGTGDLPVVGKW